MTGESRDLTVRATHAPLERTNPIAPPSCPPAAGRSRGESRPERNIESHGTFVMWQQFRQLEMPHEILKVCLLWKLKAKNKSKRERGRKQIAPRCISRCRHFQRCLPACLGSVVRDREARRSRCPNQSNRQKTREWIRKKEKAVHFFRYRPLTPAFGLPQCLLRWRWVPRWCFCNVGRFDSELRWWMLKDSQVRPRG